MSECTRCKPADITCQISAECKKQRRESMNGRLTHVKIFKSDEGVQSVICHRTHNIKAVKKCEHCDRYVSIDPVKSEIVCREW